VQFSNLQVIGQRRKLLRLHPGGTREGFEPVHALRLRTERLESARAWRPFGALAPPGWLYMRASWGEVHDLLLMPPEHGRHACVDKQGQMGRGTNAPVGPSHLTGAQVRMEVDSLGEVMDAQGDRQDVYAQSGPRMTQRQQVCHRATTAGKWFARLANMLLQGRGIGHGTPGAVPPKGARAQPASLMEGVVLQGAAHGAQQFRAHRERELHARLTIGGRGHGERGERPQGHARRMAMPHLDKNKWSVVTGLRVRSRHR
jgi:hypothetical protein